MLTIHVLPPRSEQPTNHALTSGAFDIGRSQSTDGVPRCVILSDPSVSRNHARIAEETDGQVRVTNTSARMGIWCAVGTIAPGESRLFAVPATFKVGDTIVTVEHPPDDDGVDVRSLATLAVSPLLKARLGKLGSNAESGHDPAVVAGWFETLIAVQRAPAGSKDFYEQTARALVDLIGMDVGLVMLLQPHRMERDLAVCRCCRG